MTKKGGRQRRQDKKELDIEVDCRENACKRFPSHFDLQEC